MFFQSQFSRLFFFSFSSKEDSELVLLEETLLLEISDLLSTLSLSTQMMVMPTMVTMRLTTRVTTMLATLSHNSGHVPSVREMTPM